MVDQPAPPAPSSPFSQAIEWVLALLSGVVTLALFGFLVFEAVTDTGGYPEIRLRLVDLRESGGQFFADVAVTNEGDAAAAELEVVAETGEGGPTSAAILDYAPAQSTKNLSLGFKERVTAETITLMVGGYRQP
jgi:uncharacterized protein (TIGR02588 family)